MSSQSQIIKRSKFATSKLQIHKARHFVHDQKMEHSNIINVELDTKYTLQERGIASFLLEILNEKLNKKLNEYTDIPASHHDLHP